MLLAQSERGYLNLCELSSIAYVECDAADEPHVTWRQVAERAEGLILLSGGPDGPVDPLFIFASNFFRREGYVPRVVEFMTASEYCELPGFLGWIVKHMRVIPVARTGSDMEAAKEALRRLKQGRIVGVFPEGRLNTGDGLLAGNPGIAWLALRGGVPVYPVFIHNAPRAGGARCPRRPG